MLNSKVYVGRVCHTRIRPQRHQFCYRLFMLYLDLDEIPDVFDAFWLWSARSTALARFRRSDHTGNPLQSLDQSIRHLVESQSGNRPGGRITLLTHLRYLGYGMNPVSFYFCWDESGQKVTHVVAEVNNTPWGEQHCYVLKCPENVALGEKNFEFDKVFHVSPFMEMNQRYHWQFSQPDNGLEVTMRSFEEGHLIFSANLKMQAKQITSRNLANCLLRFPIMTVRVVAAIYWQAMRLWLKRIPFVPHPKSTIQ